MISTDNKNQESISIPSPMLPNFQNRDFVITEYGAVGDGLTLNTVAINTAINTCNANGGGRVVIPAGVWLTGPIKLQNNVNLYTEQGALVIFSDNFDEYGSVNTYYEGYPTMRCGSPISAVNAYNIAITGKGIFDGNGQAWRPVKRWKMTQPQWDKLIKSGGYVTGAGNDSVWWPSHNAAEGNGYNNTVSGKVSDPKKFLIYRDFFRPVMVSFVNCNTILLDGVTFQNSPAWCVHPFKCENITIRNCNIRNPWYAQNGDGLDLECCRFVSIENCTFDVGDDAICMKSGKNAEGRKLASPTEFVSIKNCTVYHGHGGFTIGSEMSSGVRNVKISNCTFVGTDIGIRMKSCIGRGGTVENIYISNINMCAIAEDAVSLIMSYSSAIDSGSRFAQYSIDDVPRFMNIYLKDIVCSGAVRAINISGLEQTPCVINNIFFDDCSFKAESGISNNFASNVSLNNVDICTNKNKLQAYKFFKTILPERNYIME
ncbi:MAG TPA: glycoside hydrolase [Ruminococcaceae bacterium]|nr:glycoside hydrolase [Oscillospiraceae bacterium]